MIENTMQRFYFIKVSEKKSKKGGWIIKIKLMQIAHNVPDYINHIDYETTSDKTLIETIKDYLKNYLYVSEYDLLYTDYSINEITIS